MLADETAIASSLNNSKQKIDFSTLTEVLPQLLAKNSIHKGTLTKKICKLFDAGDSTVRKRLKDLMESQTSMTDQEGKQVILAETKNGRQYFLQATD